MIEQKLTRVEGQELAFLAANEHLDTPCVVFLHGILGSIHFWTKVLPADVRSAMRWYSFSLPGHFPSRWDATDRNLSEEQLARFMLQAIQSRIGPRSVSLIGWSTGAFAALNLAAHFPEYVDRVLSIAGFSRGRWRGGMGALQKLTRLGPPGRFTFDQCIRLLQLSYPVFVFAHARHARDRASFSRSRIGREVLRAVYHDFQHHQPAALQAMCKHLAAFDISSRLEAIRCPATIVGGTHDPIIPIGHTEALAEAIPHSQLVAWSGCGHMFFAERTELFHQLLRQWLSAPGLIPQLTSVA